MIHKKLRDSEKLADDFLVERNRADLCLHSYYVGIYIDDINKKPLPKLRKPTVTLRFQRRVFSVIDSIL